MPSKFFWSFIIGFSVGYIAIIATAEDETDFQGQGRMLPGEKTAAMPFYPYVALLKIKKIMSPRDFQYCAGTIIGERYIVTAASCVRYLAYNIQAFVNIRDLNNDEKLETTSSKSTSTSTERSVYSVQRIMHRKGFIASLAGLLPRKDLAILKLKEKIENPALIANISGSNQGLGELPKLVNGSNPEDSKNENKFRMMEFKYVAVGYGYNHNPIGEITPRQYHSEVTILPPRTCRNKYPFFDNKTMICAEGYKGTGGPCYNDIGGPIFKATEQMDGEKGKPVMMTVQNATMVGVISAVSARCDQPFVATRVSYFSDWISRNIK